MQLQKFLIAPIESGEQSNRPPFMLPQDAFDYLNNAYVFRGKVRSRYGTTPLTIQGTQEEKDLQSRLRVLLGETDATGLLAQTDTLIPLVNGQSFSLSGEIITIIDINNATASDRYISTDPDIEVILENQSIQITSSDFNNTNLYFYPSLPCMGFYNVAQDDISTTDLYAFDTRFMYQYENNQFSRIDGVSWSGTDANFFSQAVYIPALSSERQVWIVNDNPNDGIILYRPDDDTVDLNQSIILNEDRNEYMYSARAVVEYEKSLLFLGPWIGDVPDDPSSAQKFRNRIVCSNDFQDPSIQDAFRDDLNKNNAYSIYAPTDERVVSAINIKDKLILFFEKSTYQLSPTGIGKPLFRLQQVSYDLGCESTNSTVLINNLAIAVGNVGIHQTNGNVVSRIDEKIPDQVFRINNSQNGVERVDGIKDYFNEIIYWTYPELSSSAKFPDKVLFYNYENKTWARMDDSITCFGYAQRQTFLTWSEITWRWRDWGTPWSSGAFNRLYKDVIAGNQQGFVFILNNELSGNARNLYVTNITQPDTNIDDLLIECYNHNLKQGDYIQFHYIKSNPPDLSMKNLENKSHVVKNIFDENRFYISGNIENPLTGVDEYLGGGYIERIYNIDIITKEYNFFLDKGFYSDIPSVHFYVSKTPVGELVVDSFANTSIRSLFQDGLNTGSWLGTSNLDTFAYNLVPQEQFQSRLWHPVYLQAEGATIRLRLRRNELQMENLAIAKSYFELYAMLFYVQVGQGVL